MTRPARPEHRDYRKLPDAVPLEDVITTQEAAPPPGPEGDQNPDRDFMLRYSG